jgi:hypothetical protein
MLAHPCQAVGHASRGGPCAHCRLLRGTWTTLTVGGVAAGYQPPAVLGIAPSQLPVTGGTITIAGTGFGASACVDPLLQSLVDVLVTQIPSDSSLARGPDGVWLPQGALVLTRQSCVVTAWTPESIQCVIPPGVDAALTVRVVVGGQSNTTHGLVGFSAPVVTGVTAPYPPRTRGGDAIIVNATGVPSLPWPLAILVGGAPCEEVPSSRTGVSTECWTPRGAGSAAVQLFTPLQASGATVHVVYAGPYIAGVETPQGRPIEGGFLVDVSGEVRCTAPRGSGSLRPPPPSSVHIRPRPVRTWLSGCPHPPSPRIHPPIIPSAHPRPPPPHPPFFRTSSPP